MARSILFSSNQVSSIVLAMMLQLTFLPVPGFASVSADEIVKKADESRGLDGTYSLTATVQNVNGSKSQEMAYRVSIKGDDRALIDQTGPVRLAGRKLLMRDQDLWMYTPNMKQMTRISFEQRLSGEVANGDLARTRFGQDYSAILDGEEKVDGKNCYKIKLTSRRKGTTYAKIDYWVEKGSYLPLKSVFYALSGKPLKTAVYSDFKTIQGKKRLTKMIVQDILDPKRKSTLLYTGYRKERLEDSFFSKESLGE